MGRSKQCSVLFRDCVVCLLLAVSYQAAWAQAAITSGSVRGVVADNSGAVIAGASVVLTSRAHGQSQTRASNSTGANGFGGLQRINALNGPRVLQFALKYSF
jgi:hypothetical protein